MPFKRMRVFAGANGSGKSTIFESLSRKFKFGIYVNADEIEKELILNKSLDFNAFSLEIDELLIQDFFKQSNFSPKM
jgi:predicted ABC-type ATPase